MTVPAFRRLIAGQGNLSADEFNRLFLTVERHDKASASGVIAVGYDSSGLRITDNRIGYFKAVITSGTQPYAWNEVYWDGTGTWKNLIDGQAGTLTSNQAYEQTGSTNVQAGTVVDMKLNDDLASYAFTAGSVTQFGPSSNWFWAAITRIGSSSTSYHFVEQTELTPGTWIAKPGGKTDVNTGLFAYPINATTGLANGTIVQAWLSPLSDCYLFIDPATGGSAISIINQVGFWARLTGATQLEVTSVGQVSGGSVALGLYNCVICYQLADGSIVLGTRPPAPVKVSASGHYLSFNQPVTQVPAGATGWSPYVATIDQENFLTFAYCKQNGLNVWIPMGTTNFLLNVVTNDTTINPLTHLQTRKAWTWVEQQPIAGLPGTMEDMPGGRTNITTGLSAFEVNGFDPDTIQFGQGNRPTVWLWQATDSSCYFYEYDIPIPKWFTTCCPPASVPDTLHATITNGVGCNWTAGTSITLKRITGEEWQGAVNCTVNSVAHVVTITVGCCRPDQGEVGFAIKIQCDNGPLLILPDPSGSNRCSPFQLGTEVGFDPGWGGCCNGTMQIDITE
jgi:hypothetical protein